jgi:GTP 3',8-cyclase
MQDNFGREINYLRLSLTDLCNFRCNYCMPPEGVKKLPHENVLRLEEMLEVVRLMANRLGFTKVRVTGGEPLIRRDMMSFMEGLGQIDAIRDLALTTNAYKLAEMADDLKSAGLNRLNISLDTLRRDRFEHITGVDGIEQVLTGIRAACAVGFKPIKMNVVAMAETLDEACDMVAFGFEHNVEIRFIELMPVIGRSEPTYIPNEVVLQELAKRYDLTPARSNGNAAGLDLHSAAATYRIKTTGTGPTLESTCGFISPISHPFCSRCNRIRINASGQIKPCLARNQVYETMPFVRPELQADKLTEFISDVVGRCKRRSAGDYEIDSMSVFGG